MSFQYNHVTLVGRLTKDPETKTVSEVMRSSFKLAVDRNYRKDDGTRDTDFISVVAWSKLAEISQQYLKKGMPVLVDGKVQVRTYDKDGVKHWITEIIGDNIQILVTADKGGKSEKKK